MPQPFPIHVADLLAKIDRQSLDNIQIALVNIVIIIIVSGKMHGKVFRHVPLKSGDI